MNCAAKVVIVIVIIFVVLLLFGCFWKQLFCSGSSTKLFKKKDCGGGWCKRCGSIPCCCNSAEVCNVKRDYVGPSTVGEPDEYIITVEGAGLTQSAISNVELRISSTAGGAVYETMTYPNAGLGFYLVYSTSGYTLTIPYTTSNGVGDPAAGPVPAGPLTAGNMSPIITYSITGSVLTLNLVVPNV